MDLLDFIKGQSDCRKGLPADQKGSSLYLRGYAAEYELQEINSNNVKGDENGFKKTYRTAQS